ncbi:MAG: hypothetical protein ACLUOI_05800 [Eisenbergiella sp.]
MTDEGSRFLDKEALQRYKEYLIKEERAKATVDKYLHDVRVFEAFVRREQSCEADWNSAADTSRKAVTKEKVIEFKHNSSPFIMSGASIRCWRLSTAFSALWTGRIFV